MFRISRPAASLQGQASAFGGCSARTGLLDLPEKYGIHPYVMISSPAAPDHTILTVCTAAPAGESHGILVAARDGESWRLSGTHRGRTIRARINVAPEIPEVTL
jgi:hypothetical protein